MSNIRMAKLLVPSGGLLQDSAGETFSPTQFGFDLLLPAIFVASRSPSLKLVDDNVNTPCAAAFWAPHSAPTATVKAKIELFLSMILPFVVALLLSVASSGARHGAGLRIALQHLILQNTPDFSVKGVKFFFHPHFGNVARARQRHLPVADNARGRTG